MGCTSASRRGGPAWGSGGVTTLTVRAFGNRSGCRFHRVCMPDFTAFWIASRRAARPYRQRSSGGDYSSPLPIGCTFISNRGTTEGASPNSPSPRAGSRRPHVPCWRSRHCPADKRAALASRPFVLSGVTSGCCRRCSDLGRHQCRSLSSLGSGAVVVVEDVSVDVVAEESGAGSSAKATVALANERPAQTISERTSLRSMFPSIRYDPSGLLLGGAEPPGSRRIRLLAARRFA